VTALWDLGVEIRRQNEVHPHGYPATRDGVFLGIKTAVHELDVEAIGEWDKAKRTEAWGDTGLRDELVQAAAIIVRLIHSIDAEDGA
jgi:hypothetical protein